MLGACLGVVAFYTGILPYTQDEAGMAVVMGHEIGACGCGTFCGKGKSCPIAARWWDVTFEHDAWTEESCGYSTGIWNWISSGGNSPFLERTSWKRIN